MDCHARQPSLLPSACPRSQRLLGAGALVQLRGWRQSECRCNLAAAMQVGSRMMKQRAGRRSEQASRHPTPPLALEQASSNGTQLEGAAQQDRPTAAMTRDRWRTARFSWHRVVHRVLHVSLHTKILVANGVLVAAGIVGGMWTSAATGVVNSLPAMLLAVGVGLLLCLIVNWLILRAALWPLAMLERTARAVQHGELTARVPPLVIGDPDTDRLAATFNQMLASLETHSRQLEASAYELQRLSGRVLTAQEEERQQVARELHDETGQALTTILIGLHMLHTAPDLTQAHAQAAGLTELARQTLDDVRRLAQGLHPQTLDDLGLVAGVRRYVEEWNRAVPIAGAFTATGDALKAEVPTPIALALYRVIQEALTNVARHSGAETVRVQLDCDNSLMTARVEDDGWGFDPAKPAADGNEGMGLVGMRERTALVGGQLTIDSVAGGGTRIVAQVSLKTAYSP